MSQEIYSRQVIYHPSLQDLWPQQFLQVLRCAAATALASVLHVSKVAAAIDRTLKASKASRSLVSIVVAEFGEVTQAVNEAAHSRWIKLLASRCVVYLKGLRNQQQG